MNEQAKPSAGALRAAIALMRDASQNKARIGSDIELMAQPITHRVAHIIDRETGVAELLTVAKEYVQFANKPPWESRPFDHDIWLGRLEQAIAKAEAK